MNIYIVLDKPDTHCWFAPKSLMNISNEHLMVVIDDEHESMVILNHF